jgi:hypothetical protein
MLKRLIALLIVLCWSATALAAHPLITDDAFTQGKGNFQFEIDGESSHQNKDGVVVDATVITSMLTYGIIDQTDIILGIPYSYLRQADSATNTEYGISDTSLALKWKFYEKGGLSLAFKPGITLPTGNDERGLGSGRATYNIFFIATEVIGPWLIHLNLGYKRNENKVDAREDLWHASLAGEMKITKNFRAVVNVGVETNPDRSSSINPVFIIGGIIYSIRENFDLDFGLKSWLQSFDTDYSILAGLTLRF